MTNKTLEKQNRLTAIAWAIASEPNKPLTAHAKKWGLSPQWISRFRRSLTIRDGIVYRKGKVIASIQNNDFPDLSRAEISH